MVLTKREEKKISIYIERLVRRQPEWLKELLESGAIVFTMDEEGFLGVSIDRDLDEKVKEDALNKIGKYMEKYRSDVLKINLVH